MTKGNIKKQQITTLYCLNHSVILNIVSVTGAGVKKHILHMVPSLTFVIEKVHN